MLLPGDPPELAAYARDSLKKGSPPDDPGRFPHQSTADQFFDEQQFESYRLLGWVTAKAALGDPPPGPPARKPRKAAGLARLVATAVTAQKAAPAKSGSFGELVQQMGSGVALATAITIGGTLGVAGSVALQPAEVSLSAEDRALLRQARTPGDTGRDGSAGAKGDKGDPGPQGGGVDVPALELSPEARSALDRGIDLKGAPELTRAAADLRAAARALEVALRNGVKLDAGDHQLLQQLKLVIRSTDAKAGEPQDLTTAIHNLQQTLAVLNRNETPPALKKPLEDLMRAINNVAPRQNIRGQEGGAR
jgi:hypothetical protein